jgi:hypothetical protein
VNVSDVVLYLRKKILRGALTNGRDWIFLLIKLNDDYDGASYRQSSTIQLTATASPSGQLAMTEPWPDLIAAILSHWVSWTLISMIKLLTDWDARLKRALQTLKAMIGLNRSR